MVEMLKGGRLNGKNENWVSLQRNIAEAQADGTIPNLGTTLFNPRTKL
jgi:hypothetical protein